MGFPGGSDGKESACNVGDQVLSLGQKDPLKKGVATHSNILAWRIPWTEEPSGLQTMGSKESDTTEWIFYHGNPVNIVVCLGKTTGESLR